jgi:D-glycero-alpha-D-manno-heptose-7-phosphate kinase
MFAHLDCIQVAETASVRDVMSLFVDTAVLTHGRGFAVVVRDGVCVGVVTDGDLRKGLVGDATLDSPVTAVMTRDMVRAEQGASRHQILRLFDHRIRHVPMLDADGRLVDLFGLDDLNASAHIQTQLVRSRAPVRISFSGGGTDMSCYFSQRTGHALSTTINRHCYVSVAARADQQMSITSSDYHQSFHRDEVGNLDQDDQLGLIKACVKVMEPTFGFDLESYSEIEPGTGLGGSSAIAAAVIGAFNHFRRENQLDRYQLADLTYKAERIELGVAGGWQDQYAAVFGGFNMIEFRPDGVVVIPLRLPSDLLLELQFNLLLFRVGGSRNSGNIAAAQQRRFREQQADIVKQYEAMSALTLTMRDDLLKGSLHAFGTRLDTAWAVKKQFSPQIAPAAIDALYTAGRSAGALGGKLLGAGGSGYLLFYCEPPRQQALEDAMADQGAKRERFEFIDHGLQTWTAAEGAEPA